MKHATTELGTMGELAQEIISQALMLKLADRDAIIQELVASLDKPDE